ncbi:histidinol-phosphate transaminase [Nonomuraea phyllanthi]|uniref:histidinol-phosphate transaminase n=1 Tax=Nonomuraea phyllanthi TaxID=2219224 RepID=UPI0012933850|nr:histidinol-phosphate transaminase [Nonomuraea phyllanthi]QFY13030.1 histidinol-phosphate transaminase [Nonomuraea phyllanthi]
MGSLRIAHRLEGLPPYVPGRRPERGETRRQARLASNEVPWPPQAAIVDAMKAALDGAHRYPDMQYTELRDAIAAHVGRPVGGVAVANGSTALLRDIVGALADPGSEVVFAEPSFPYYRTAAAANSAVPVAVPLRDHAHDLDAMRGAVTPRTRVVVICNPNNPTGTAYTNAELEEFLARMPEDVAVVLDEAYVEFAEDVNGLDLMDEHPNVIVVRTLSKAHGLAGLRVGYAVGDGDVMSHVSRLGVPFRIDGVAVAGALAALRPEQVAESARRVASIVAERAVLTEALRSRGWDVVESAANFVFLPLGESAASVAAACAAGGVLVRPIGGGIRVTVGSPEDTEHLLNALPALAHHPR